MIAPILDMLTLKLSKLGDLFKAAQTKGNRTGIPAQL